MTNKAARMKDCQDCPDLLSASVYDTKPLHLLSMASNCVEWNVTQNKMWNEKATKKSFVKFLCLNMIDKYNHNMNSVDMADQFWGVYCPDHWMQNRKWWWAIWIWGIGVAGTNAYKLYEVMYEEEMKKQEPKVPSWWMHACFLEELVSNLMFSEETAKHLAMLKDMDDSTFTLSVRSMQSFLLYGCDAPKVPCDLTCALGRDKYLNIIKPHRISKFRLDCGFFRYWFDRQRHCSIPAHTNNMCQFCMHTWTHVFDNLQRKDKQKKRNSIESCID
jgi:hypothetical protein